MLRSGPKFPDQYSSRVPLIDPILIVSNWDLFGGFLQWVFHGVSSVSGCVCQDSAPRSGCAPLTLHGTVRRFIAASRRLQDSQSQRRQQHLSLCRQDAVNMHPWTFFSWKCATVLICSIFFKTYFGNWVDDEYTVRLRSADEREAVFSDVLWSFMDDRCHGNGWASGLSPAGHHIKTQDTHIAWHLPHTSTLSENRVPS